MRAPHPLPLTPHPHSAAADSDDDFQAVAADQRGAGMPAARNDLAISFDSDAFSRQVLRLDQLAQGKRRRKAAGFAIDHQFNHFFSIRGA
jgi:hypothetical protein